MQSAFMAMVAPPWLPWRRHGSSSQRSGRGLEAAGTQTHAPRAPGHHVQPLTWTLLSSPAVVCTAGSCCSVGWSVDAMRSVSLGGSGLDRRRQQISRGVIGQEGFLRIKRRKDKLYQNETKTHCAGRRANRRSSNCIKTKQRRTAQAPCMQKERRVPGRRRGL